MPEVFISQKISSASLEILTRAGIEFAVNTLDRRLNKTEMIQALQGVKGLVCARTDPIDREIIDSTRTLKVITNVAVGYDNIDIAAATARGIMVTNTPDVLTETTADLAFALMISAARRITEGDSSARKGKIEEWQLMQRTMGSDVYGKTLGIIGMGRIGLAMARRGCLGFKMNVLYYNRNHNRTAEDELNARYVSFDDLLKNSDFISIHVPLNESTRHLIGAAELKKMKSSAFLINTARGQVVDEGALAAALANHTIQGAGLDVYEDEPNIPPSLLNIRENLVLTPHVGSATLATRTQMTIMAVENMVAALRGEIPPNLVNATKR
jgi:glyoxylate reductase